MVEDRMLIEEFVSLLCQASPLAWCAGVGVEHASEWEKRAVVLIRRATEHLKAAQQPITAPGRPLRKSPKKATSA